MRLPTLYKKSSVGAIQQWEIWTEGATIRVRYGQVGGAMQDSSDLVKSGKNAGKVNATTAEEQAAAEATSKWEKQKKKGYVESAEGAKAGEVDDLIEGGVLPMLAHKYRDHAAKIKWPAKAQPKLDGIRCEAILKDGVCTLWSRTRKPITGVPHIARAIEQALPGGDGWVFDGELYNHGLKKDFEQIISHVRQATPQPGSEIVEYHIYDNADSSAGTFEHRSQSLKEVLGGKHAKLVLVETVDVANEEALLEYFADCLARGYEGAMVRNAKSLYENKRSYGLQKVKEFDDGEWVIAATMEGRGSMAGKAVFGCKLDPKLPTVMKDGEYDTDDPNQFACKMEGSLAALSKFLNNPKVIGKQLMIRYQKFTKYNKPRFPVGVRIRDFDIE